MSGFSIEGKIVIEGTRLEVEYEPSGMTGSSVLYLRVKGPNRNIPITVGTVDEVIEMLSRGKKAIETLEEGEEVVIHEGPEPERPAPPPPPPPRVIKDPSLLRALSEALSGLFKKPTRSVPNKPTSTPPPPPRQPPSSWMGYRWIGGQTKPIRSERPEDRPKPSPNPPKRCCRCGRQH